MMGSKFFSSRHWLGVLIGIMGIGAGYRGEAVAQDQVRIRDHFYAAQLFLPMKGGLSAVSARSTIRKIVGKPGKNKRVKYLTLFMGCGLSVPPKDGCPANRDSFSILPMGEKPGIGK